MSGLVQLVLRGFTNMEQNLHALEAWLLKLNCNHMTLVRHKLSLITAKHNAGLVHANMFNKDCKIWGKTITRLVFTQNHHEQRDMSTAGHGSIARWQGHPDDNIEGDRNRHNSRYSKTTRTLWKRSPMSALSAGKFDSSQGKR